MVLAVEVVATSVPKAGNLNIQSGLDEIKVISACRSYISNTLYISKVLKTTGQSHKKALQHPLAPAGHKLGGGKILAGQ